MWKEVLDFDLRAVGLHSPVKDLVAGKTFSRPTGGFSGVANVGLDANWLGHPFAMANLYRFSRLALNSHLCADAIAKEWDILTFRSEPALLHTISFLLL